MNPHPTLGDGRRWLVPVLALALLAGCATPTPTPQLQAQVQQLLTSRDPVVPSPDATAPLRPGPAALGQDDAVRLALLNNPVVQAHWAQLALAEAEAARVGALPNPHLALARLREGDSREVERLLRIDLLALLTLPARADAAQAERDRARLEAAQALAQLAADTRRAWVQAVAAEQAAVYLGQAYDATEAAFELAQRMAAVGNWPQLRRVQQQQTRAEAARDLALARHEAFAARQRLAQMLGLWGKDADFALPDRLPAVPRALPADRAGGEGLQARAVRERLDLLAARAALAQAQRSAGISRARAWLPDVELGLIHNTHTGGSGEREHSRGAELEIALPLSDGGSIARSTAEASLRLAQARLAEAAVQARSQVAQAWHAWRTAHDLALQAQAELVPLAERMTEEVLLRYNGMLASPWDLLAQARQQRLAVREAIAAQRDFWLSDIDLTQALTVGPPQGESLPARTGSASAQPKGH